MTPSNPNSPSPQTEGNALERQSLQWLLYTPNLQAEWDALVGRSCNGTFLHTRPYMDYHAHRFTDCSRMLYRKGRLVAVLPAHTQGEGVGCHLGLTYGGMVCAPELHGSEVLQAFGMLVNAFKAEGASYLDYRPVPHIYHRQFCQDDIYALFRLGAQRIACQLCSVVELPLQRRLSSLRREGIRRAMRAGVEICQQQDLGGFWALLSENLRLNHQASPVHTLSEMELLRDRFPDRIRLYTAHRAGELLGGVLLYITDTVVRAQYASASPQGKAAGALDLLFDTLLRQSWPQRYFDFGSSNEQGGLVLNEGLLFQKEGFGCRGVVAKQYRISLC